MKTQDINAATFAEIMARIQIVTNTKTQVELAEFLGIRQSSISDAKKRHSIPAEWLLKLFTEIGTNPKWVMTGGESLIDSDFPTEVQSVQKHTQGKPLEDYSTEELLSEIVSRALGVNQK